MKRRPIALFSSFVLTFTPEWLFVTAKAWFLPRIPTKPVVDINSIHKEMEFESNWKSKTLENLEKDYWGKPREESQTVTRCHDLRIMISQGIGLNYLLPLAIEELKKNLLAEGDLFEGDLLEGVRKIKTAFWVEHPEYEEQVDSLIARNAQILKAEGLSNRLIKD